MNSSATTLEQTRSLLPVRLLNGCGALLEKTRIPRSPILAPDLIETAMRRCGLNDFGKGDFRDSSRGDGADGDGAIGDGADCGAR